MRHYAPLRAALHYSLPLMGTQITRKRSSRLRIPPKPTAPQTPHPTRQTPSPFPFSSTAEVERFFVHRLRHPLTGSLLPPPFAAHVHTFASAAPFSAREGTAQDDIRLHRRLSDRFTSAVDQEKAYNGDEMDFHALRDDISTRLRWAREARRLLHQTLLQTNRTDSRSTNSTGRDAMGSVCFVPSRLVVLVLYSHTQHNAAVGQHMRRIRDGVKAMLAERYRDVLGVLTIAVGVKWRDLRADGSGVNREWNGSNELGDGVEARGKRDGMEENTHEDVLWYPNAGIYSLNALMQSLCGVESDDASPELGPPLHRRILVVSESWFHVRTIAELYERGANRDSDKREGKLENTLCDTVSVEPMPFVLGSAHSEEEIKQFARYTACRALIN